MTTIVLLAGVELVLVLLLVSLTLLPALNGEGGAHDGGAKQEVNYHDEIWV